MSAGPGERVVAVPELAPEYAPDRGIMRLPRAHLEAIVGGDERALEPGSDIGRLLVALGVVADGRVDDSLRPVLDVLRRPTARFGLRMEDAARVDRRRGWIAPAGVVTVSGGTGEADVQDLRVAPRASAAGRVLATLLDLGPARPVDHLPEEPLTWDEVMVPVREGPGTGWARDALGPLSPVRLAHLRWSSDGVRPATTALVLLTAGDAGLVEAIASDEGHVLVGRSPTQVWTGLCALTRATA